VTVYGLYLESGPQHRKTMVHILDLLGCVVRGATTEDALAATTGGIGDYLAFLRAQGERVPAARDRIETSVVIHTTEGKRLGEGDPDGGFAPDFAPLSEADARTYALRLDAMQHEFAGLLADLPARTLAAEPDAGRSLLRILGHLAGAQYGYLQGPLSKPAGLSAAVRAVEEGPDPLGAFEECRALVRARLAGVTEAERTATVRHGAKQWTVRRALRRSLEHQWEHLVEVRQRLA
jgi:predicted RNase H-like HicB family nuclease